jgi:hypothetical protein
MWRNCGGTTIFESEKSGAWSIFSKFGSEETGSLDFCLIIYYKRVLGKLF